MSACGRRRTPELDLLQRVGRLDAVGIRMLAQPILEVGLSRNVGGHAIDEKRHLLHHAPAHDLVVAVHAFGNAFAVDDLVPYRPQADIT